MLAAPRAVANREMDYDFSSANIMVVDDHPINLMFARKLLKKLGVERVQMVDNGQEAFEYTQVNMYDAILMDCQMPGMDGFQTTQAIRKMHKGQNLHTPIIAVTANAMKGDREKCIAAGMDDYISKPIDPNSLVDVLARWVKPSRIVARQAEANHEKSLKQQGMDAPVDLEGLRSIFDGGSDEEKMLFDLFYETAAECCAKLQSSMDDDEAWRKAAHKLKGSAANMRATTLAGLCYTAERSNTAGEDEKTQMLNGIRRELEKIKEYLSSVVEGSSPFV